ncbi:ASCH domain-containing protein [Maridesulfovibrio sp.]|uniref:ASCH domain-containing protein n=1 Tax=Maridesulfovibrio sp. TaxID=2795000 RepID=UPI0039EF2DAD
MAIIFLPIKPEYVSRILDGSKVYEYRKTLPKQNISHIVIYASSPLKQIVGIAKVEKIIASPVSDLWCETEMSSGITEKKFFEYFEGKEIAYAFKLTKIRRFKSSFSPFDLWSDFHIPQSFTYLRKDFFDEVLSLSFEYV